MAEPFKSELDWSPESWFGRRVAKPDGTRYTDEDVKSLSSHLQEYYDIERNSKANGTWLNMPDGSQWSEDPRSWVMMQSKAFKENYSQQPWWTGQARWKTNDQYGDKVARAPYHNGQMWFSDRKEYGDYFANIIDSRGFGDRADYDPNDDGTYPEEHITGHNFLAAVPREGKYRYLEPPKSTVKWQYMPYDFVGETIKYNPNKYTNGQNKNNKTLTDDIVNQSHELGDQGIFMYNIDDGPSQMGPRDSEGYVPTKNLPVNEFISQPGFTNKVKFVEGNNGDFDINNPYKYAYVPTTKEGILRAFYGTKLRKLKI